VNIELENNRLALTDIYDDKSSTVDIALLKKTSNKLKNNRKIAFVIDGQHRLRAFDYSSRKGYPLIVAALIDLSPELVNENETPPSRI
jgi:hypothetical protein